MKRVVLALAIMMFGLTNAQVKFGINGGFSSAVVSDDFDELTAGYYAGVFTEFGIPGFAKMQPAVNYVKFKVFPLTIEMMYVLIICTLAINIAIMLPETTSNLVNLCYKPAFVLMVIFGANHVMKIFPVEQYLNKKFFKSLFKF